MVSWLTGRKTPILFAFCWDITVTHTHIYYIYIYIRIIMQNACASRVCVRSWCVCVCVYGESEGGGGGEESRNLSTVHITAATETGSENGAVPMEKTAHAELQAHASLTGCLCLARQREKTRSKRGWRDTIASDLAVYSMCSHHDSYGGHRKCRLVLTAFVVTWLPGRNPRQQQDCPRWEHKPCPIASCDPVETASVSAYAASVSLHEHCGCKVVCVMLCCSLGEAVTSQ